MEDLKAITTVYSYYFPEVRKVIDNLTKNYPHDVFLKSVSPGLDDFHVPIIDKFARYQKEALPGLSDFPFRYPIAGAEEGIRETMTNLRQERTRHIYALFGEYEGYKAVAETRGIETVEVGIDLEPPFVMIFPFFISNPSARDGNILPDSYIGKLCQNHDVYYDLTYLGLVEPHQFDLRNPKIKAVFISFSKPFGLFYYRVGFLFSRFEIPALYGNKWFKNIFSLLIADKVMDEIGPLDIFNKYKPIQEMIIEDINKKTGLGIKPSKSLLLGYLPEEDAKNLNEKQLEMISKFRRCDNYRFCLTPYFEELEKKGAF